MAGLADRAVRAGMRKGLRRGVLDGNRVWLTIGVASVAVRLLQRLASPGDPIIVTERLAPGETLVIRHLPPPD